MPIFEKLPQILRLCPIVKFRSTLEKLDPPNILLTPSTEKSCRNHCNRTSLCSTVLNKKSVKFIPTIFFDFPKFVINLMASNLEMIVFV